MRPEERGRYCGSCKKTVVDLMGMSDPEIVAYLAGAGQDLCGRLEPDQMERALSVRPEVPKSLWKGWHWLLGGLLFAGRVQGQTRAVKAPMQQVWAGGAGHRPIAARVPIRERIVPVVEAGTTDSLTGERIVYQDLAPAIVTGYANRTYSGYLGGISVGVVVRKSWMKQVKDTLTTCGLLPKKSLTVYPNPVSRGAVIQLSWQTEPGSYLVGIYSMTGVLLLQKTLQINEGQQVDLVAIPAAAAAGVYVVRAVRAGGGKGISRELIVL